MNALLGLEGSIPANDRVINPPFGNAIDFDKIVAEAFKDYDVLCAMNFDDGPNSMTLPQLATLLEVVHGIAQN